MSQVWQFCMFWFLMGKSLIHGYYYVLKLKNKILTQPPRKKNLKYWKMYDKMLLVKPSLACIVTYLSIHMFSKASSRQLFRIYKSTSLKPLLF